MAWEDFLTAVQGGTPARVPVALFVDDAFIAGAYGIDTVDFFMYPDQWLAAHLALAERFPDIVFLPGLWANFGAATESSAFGTPAVWRHGQVPGLRTLNLPPATWRSFPRPDPRSDGLMALALRRCFNLEQRGELPEPHRIFFAAARGPFTLAAQLVGGPRFISALADDSADTDAALDLLDMLIDTVQRFLQAQLGYLRDPVGVILMDDAAGMLPPDLFTQLALPFLQRILASLTGVVRLLHCAAPCEGLLPYLSALDIDVFHGHHSLSVAALRRAFPPHVAVMAGLAPHGVMLKGSSEQVEAEARALIQQGGGAAAGMILSVGGFLHPDTPAASLDALTAATWR